MNTISYRFFHEAIRFFSKLQDGHFFANLARKDAFSPRDLSLQESNPYNFYSKTHHQRL